jgi:hypothetical protein
MTSYKVIGGALELLNRTWQGSLVICCRWLVIAHRMFPTLHQLMSLCPGRESIMVLQDWIAEYNMSVYLCGMVSSFLVDELSLTIMKDRD